MMRGAANALAFMHEAGVVHRSLGAPSLRVNTLGTSTSTVQPYGGRGRGRGARLGRGMIGPPYSHIYLGGGVVVVEGIS